MQFTAILRGLIFYLSCFIIGFLLGAFVGGTFLVPRDAGLAGGAMVIGYGLMGAVLGLILAYVAQRQLSENNYLRAVWIAGIIGLLGLVAFLFRFATNRTAAGPELSATPQITQSVTAPAAQLVSQSEAGVIGMGMAMPILSPAQTLYFYGPRNKPVYDSITFQQNDHHTEMAYAPPWFYPEYSKLDYDILLLRVVSLQQNRLEVIVNQRSGQTAWIDRQAVSWQAWPSFLLSVSSVEPLRIADFPMRVKPLDHAGLYLRPPNEPWQAITIQGEWMQIKDGGWIRWRNCDGLLIRYVMLS